MNKEEVRKLSMPKLEPAPKEALEVSEAKKKTKKISPKKEKKSKKTDNEQKLNAD